MKIVNENLIEIVKSKISELEELLWETSETFEPDLFLSLQKKYRDLSNALFYMDFSEMLIHLKQADILIDHWYDSRTAKDFESNNHEFVKKHNSYSPRLTRKRNANSNRIFSNLNGPEKNNSDRFKDVRSKDKEFTYAPGISYNEVLINDPFLNPKEKPESESLPLNKIAELENQRLQKEFENSSFKNRRFSQDEVIKDIQKEFSDLKNSESNNSFMRNRTFEHGNRLNRYAHIKLGSGNNKEKLNSNKPLSVSENLSQHFKFKTKDNQEREFDTNDVSTFFDKRNGFSGVQIDKDASNENNENYRPSEKTNQQDPQSLKKLFLDDIKERMENNENFKNLKAFSDAALVTKTSDLDVLRISKIDDKKVTNKYIEADRIRNKQLEQLALENKKEYQNVYNLFAKQDFNDVYLKKIRKDKK